MNVKVYKTKKVILGDTLFPILDDSLPKLKENSVVVITSKIVAICQGRVIKNDERLKDALVAKEAEYFIDKKHNQYRFHITIKHNTIIASAGIDESNGNNFFVLWPKDLQKTANEIWNYLRHKYQIKNLGVIITDSKLTPLRWGVTGVGLAHCGFCALNDYRGQPDIFGRKLKVTQTSVLDGLAAAAVVVMGEGDEQTPLAVISDVPFVTFQKRIPTKKEINFLHIKVGADVFAPFLKSPLWQKGQG